MGQRQRLVNQDVNPPWTKSLTTALGLLRLLTRQRYSPESAACAGESEREKGGGRSGGEDGREEKPPPPPLEDCARGRGGGGAARVMRPSSWTGKLEEASGCLDVVPSAASAVY